MHDALFLYPTHTQSQHYQHFIYSHYMVNGEAYTTLSLGKLFCC